jgi:hypothetical protein
MYHFLKIKKYNSIENKKKIKLSQYEFTFKVKINVNKERNMTRLDKNNKTIY